jgi:hypothetical protein
MGNAFLLKKAGKDRRKLAKKCPLLPGKTRHFMKIVTIYDSDTKEIICFRYVVDASGHIGVSEKTIKRHILSKKPIKNRYFVSVHWLDGSKKQIRGKGVKK